MKIRVGDSDYRKINGSRDELIDALGDCRKVTNREEWFKGLERLRVVIGEKLNASYEIRMRVRELLEEYYMKTTMTNRINIIAGLYWVAHQEEDEEIEVNEVADVLGISVSTIRKTIPKIKNLIER